VLETPIEKKTHFFRALLAYFTVRITFFNRTLLKGRPSPASLSSS
jgi:hypothetical protein